jgi:hypothetical protein
MEKNPRSGGCGGSEARAEGRSGQIALGNDPHPRGLSARSRKSRRKIVATASVRSGEVKVTHGTRVAVTLLHNRQ